MPDSLKKKTVKGVAWTSADLVINLGLNFVIGIILARLLAPSDYGLIAMIVVFNNIAYAFLDCGFGNALIRRPDITEDDTSTAFYFNLGAGVVLYGILWISGPWVALFYDTPILSSLLRAEAITLILSSGYAIQNTLLKRNLQFKKLAFVNVSSNVLSGIAAIIAAYCGWGVWSLVTMHITGGLLRLIMLWAVSSWRPRGQWSRNSFNYLWGFGSKLLASGLLNTIYDNIYPIIIGKFYSSSDLGQYSRAKQYSNLPSQSLTMVMQKVTYPVLSQIQSDDDRLSYSYRRMLRMSAFVVFPIMVGMSALAHPLVVALVTDKWAQCVPYLQIICFASMWYPIHAINLNLLQVKGRSDLFLRLEIIKKVIITIAIFCSVPFGIMGICIGSVCTSLFCLVINTYYTGKLINVGFVKQMMDLSPTLLLSLMMGALVYFSSYLFSNDIAKLAICIPIGIAFYLLCSWAFRLSELKETISIILKK